MVKAVPERSTWSQYNVEYGTVPSFTSLKSLLSFSLRSNNRQMQKFSALIMNTYTFVSEFCLTIHRELKCKNTSRSFLHKVFRTLQIYTSTLLFIFHCYSEFKPFLSFPDRVKVDVKNPVRRIKNKTKA